MYKYIFFKLYIFIRLYTVVLLYCVLFEGLNEQHSKYTHTRLNNSQINQWVTKKKNYTNTNTKNNHFNDDEEEKKLTIRQNKFV